jgi:hypothetical protein
MAMRASAWFSLVFVMALLVFGGGEASAQALGPENRAYAVDTAEGRFSAQFRSNGRYEDSRGARGSWSFDGRSLCMLVRIPYESEYEVCAPWVDLRIGQAMLTNDWTPDRSLARVTRIE